MLKIFIPALALAAVFLFVLRGSRPTLDAPLHPSGSPVTSPRVGGDAAKPVETASQRHPTVSAINDGERQAGEVESNDSDISALKRRVFGGGVTRESNGAEYQSAIDQIALDTIRRHIKSQSLERTARFAGFAHFQDAQDDLTRLEREDPIRARELEQLLNESMDVTGQVESYAFEAWRDPFCLEVWDPLGAVDHEAWRAARPVEPGSLLRFTTSTTIGDRCYSLHFDSGLFSTLEMKLQDLQVTKLAYWESQGK